MTQDPFSIRSPYESLKSSRQQRLLVAISKATAVFAVPGAIFVGTLLFFEFSWQILLVLLLSLCIIPLSLFARHLAESDRLDAASYILLFCLLFIVTANGSLIEGIFAIVAPGFVLVIAMAGMLLGPRWGYTVGAASIVLWLLARTALQLGWLVPAMLNEPWPTITVTVNTILAFIFITVLSLVATRDLQQALNDATYDLVQANRQLEEASRLKSQFTAHTSHELRSPLNAIITFTDLTLRGAYGAVNDRQEEKLDRVLQGARRLRGLIDDLLDLSKIEAGEVSIAEESFAVSNLVQTIDAVIEPVAEKKGLALSTYLSPEMPNEIVGDEKRIAQVLVNLAQNAVKFTEKGSVQVAIEPMDREHWCLSVKDTGAGIPERDFETIFQEFARLEESSSKTQGVGLGLAITNRLVKMMEGEIRLESEIGKGSTFEVVLPLRG
ncbi:MAG: HAMP domain-containing sensor histidine kinase [Chloroflexota bacterium]